MVQISIVPNQFDQCVRRKLLGKSIGRRTENTSYENIQGKAYLSPFPAATPQSLYEPTTRLREWVAKHENVTTQPRLLG